MRYCARCQKPRDRKDNKTQKGQRLCSECHAEYMRAWRAAQSAPNWIDEYLAQNERVREAA